MNKDVFVVFQDTSTELSAKRSSESVKLQWVLEALLSHNGFAACIFQTWIGNTVDIPMKKKIVPII